ncbi:hepatic lectin-like [Ruditapes philippinarum]|uniref:hepatic lectin-like n=1 Tax=Ruditapes philippinarum TaxID=129788 RepID=UPI00295B90E0|nr:hepatic lectin-like [Ruditapes philippinarum]
MCKLFGGNLVNIETATENSYLAATAKLRGHYYWIGLTDAQEESIWRWISNTGKLVYRGYFNWASGEPNNRGSDENCATISTSGFWNDIPCYKNAHYICEADNSEETIVG